MLWNKILHGLSIILLAGLPSTLPGQNNKIGYIDLESVLRLSGADNLTIEEFRKKNVLAHSEYIKTREWWLPEIYAGASTHYLAGSALNTDGRIFTGVERNSLWAGVGLAAEWDFGEGIYKVLSAKHKAEAAVYMSQAEKNKAILDVVMAYYDLLAEQAIYNALSGQVLKSDSIVFQIAAQVNAGMQYKSDLLLAKSNHNHLRINLLQIDENMKTKSAALVDQLNIEGDVILLGSASDMIPVRIIEDSEFVPASEGYLKRPEYLGLQTDLKSIEYENKLYSTALALPSIRVGTYGSMFGNAIPDLDPTMEFNTSLTWRIPLGRLVYAGDRKVGETKILLQENRIEQFKNTATREITLARVHMKSAEMQMDLAEESVKFSQEALNQSILRQKEGMARSFEVFQAQEYNLKAEQDYIRAICNFNKSQYSLFVALGNDL